MKRLFPILIFLSFSILILSCKKEHSLNNNDSLFGYFNYYSLIVSANPSNYYKDTIEHSPENYYAEINQVGSSNQLKIYFGSHNENVTVTVDYNGVGNYSSDNTNLQCKYYTYDGLYNPSYHISTSMPGTGGYMEILSEQNGIITGTLRFISGYKSPLNTVANYVGIDDCKFEIRLK